jgi:hypothetical protein
MRSPRTITLFTEQPDLSQRPSSFVVSFLIHAAVLALLSFGIIYTPEMSDRLTIRRYTVRHLDLHIVEPQMRLSADSGIEYPGPHSIARSLQPGGKPAMRPAVLRQIAQATPGPQTLLQPDLPSHLTLAQETPVPTVVIWSPQMTPVKDIVAPHPAKPTAADVTPSPDPPNEEVNLADLGISASELAAQTLPLLPSTTSPVVVHEPERVQLAPATVSNSTAQPTPAAVMSLSDLRMTEGTVTLPPVNETVLSKSSGELAPGKAQESSQAGSGNPVSKAGGTGAGQGSAAAAKSPAPAAAKPPIPATPAAKQDKAHTEATEKTEASPGNQASTGHITLPRNGQFGAVVVGASLEEQFPEIAGQWGGRLAYTVYLHVGLAKSWILQYSLPRSAEAAAAGNIARIEAPWPYNIVRPNLAPGAINADTLMVHGFVNQAGRFETLSIAFPPDFAQAQFVLNTLQQWQFRPATQNGQSVKVEVLLMIPEEPE